MKPQRPATGGLRTVGVGLAVGLVLADSSIAVLALPAIHREFDVELAELAWVLTAFNVVLALAAVPAAWLVQRFGAALVGSAGLAVFALASGVCALAPSFGTLLFARCVQAVGGAAVVVAALELLPTVIGSASRAITVWVAAGTAGAALGPALGGVLTETLSWRAVFAVQVPLALVPLPLAIGARLQPRSDSTARVRVAPNIALALLSAGLAAALFLIVLLLVEGWRLSPIAAAAVVSVLPLATIASAPVARRLESRTTRAACGALLVAGGLASLGLLPRAGWAWAVAPQILVGLGAGLALAALTESAVADRRPVALHGGVTMAARHAGVVLGLLLLTPVLVGDLDRQRAAAEEAGTASVLDSPLSPAKKLELGLAVRSELEATPGRIPDLGATVRSVGVSREERPALEELARALDDVLDRALTSSFSRSFLVAAALALGAALATALLTWRSSPRAPTFVAVAAAAALAIPAGYAALGGGSYEPPGTADPCQARPLRAATTTEALAERLALAALDGAACELGVSREELTLALPSEDERVGFARAHELVADDIDRALRAGVVRAVDAAERLDAIDESTARVLRIAAWTLPLDALIDELDLD